MPPVQLVRNVDAQGTVVAPATAAGQAALLAAVNGVKQVGVVASKTATADTPTQITSATTACQYAMVYALLDDQLAANDEICFVGLSGAGNQQEPIHPADTIEGKKIPCTAMSDLYLLTTTTGDGVRVVFYGVPS